MTFADKHVWEPAAGRGHMARPLAEYFRTVTSSDADADKLGFGFSHDFLFPAPDQIKADPPDWIITNPPFVLLDRFIDQASALSTEGVAMFCRLQVLESHDRAEKIWHAAHKPMLVMPFAERVPLVKGRIDEAARSATAYCWVVWIRGYNPKFTWVDVIPPCRALLDRPGDYAA